MKKLLVALVILASSCGFFEGDDFPEGNSVEAPDISIRTEDGKAVYVPHAQATISPHVEDWVFGQGLIEVCDTETVTKDVNPEKAKSEFVTFYYDTITKERVIGVDNLTFSEFAKLNNSTHIHLKSMSLAAASGDDFDFLSWVKIKVKKDEGSEQIAWGGPWPNNAINIPLETDGSVDLADYWTDEGLRLRFTLRAKAPSQTTYIGSRVTFLRFYNCVMR